MEELYVIKNYHKNIYYFSLLPNGCPTWVEVKEYAQYLTLKEAKRILEFIKSNSLFCSNPHDLDHEQS